MTEMSINTQLYNWMTTGKTGWVALLRKTCLVKNRTSVLLGGPISTQILGHIKSILGVNYDLKGMTVTAIPPPSRKSELKYVQIMWVRPIVRFDVFVPIFPFAPDIHSIFSQCDPFIVIPNSIGIVFCNDAIRPGVR